MKGKVSYILLLIVCSLANQLAAKDTEPKKEVEKKQLYIGVEARRMPYSDVDEAQKAQGILIDAATNVCDRMNAKCRFISANFTSLLQQLATQQLHAVLNIDTVILPKVDKLKLSPPLCRIKPVFIQHKSANKKTLDDFKRTTIGVLEGSLLHFYLLDHYSSFARLRAYPVLENGIFDLVSERIDALYADKAFFQYRVASTSLGRTNTPPTLIAQPVEDTQTDPQTDQQPLAPISMAFILRDNDEELFNLLKKTLTTQEQPPDCASLLSDNKQQQPKLKQPTSTTEAEK